MALLSETDVSDVIITCLQCTVHKSMECWQDDVII